MTQPKRYPDGSSLGSIRRWLRNSHVEELPGLLTIRVVIDASIILADLRWLTTKRSNPNAKTALLETLKAGTVAGYAPPELVLEVERHIPRVAREGGIAEERLRMEWQEYRSLISVVPTPPGPPADWGKGVGDPDDAPYLHLHLALHAPVYTKDSHLTAMGATVIGPGVLTDLRTYTRASAARWSLLVGTSVATFAIGSAALHLMTAGIRFARTRPVLMLGALGIGIIAWAYLRKTNTSSRELANTALAKGRDALGSVGTFAYMVLEEIAKADQAGANALSKVEARIPNEAMVRARTA
jgi:predicted nucleic acid-binding protein